MEKISPKAALKTIFFANSGGLSSKRVMGVFGFLVCCLVFIAGFIFQKEIPDFGELLVTVSASLLGIDSITSIWSKSVNKS